MIISDETVECRQFQADESVDELKEQKTNDSNHALTLNLQIRNRVFQSTKSVQDNFERFFGNINDKTNGHLFKHTSDGDLNVILAVNDNGLL